MKWKLTVAMSALMVAISIFMAAGIYYYMKRDYLEAVNNNRLLVVSTLATSAFEALLREDMSSIAFLGEQFGRHTDVLSVMVLDQGNKVVYDSRHRFEGKVFADTLGGPHFRPVIVDGKKGVEVAAPFKIGETKWATAAVVYSMDIVSNEVTRILEITSFFGLLGIIVGVITSSALASWITLPIEELTKGMNAVENGDLDYRIKIDSHDELEWVGNEFNSMLKQLKDAQLTLMEKEKLAAICEIAGAAAHEINQPLTVIIGNIDLLLSEKRTDEAKMRKVLDTINKAAKELASIVKKMAKIKRYETESYVGNVKIVDIDKASSE